jgi:hypothetical protein
MRISVNVIALPTRFHFGKRQDACLEPRTRLLTSIIPDGMGNRIDRKPAAPRASLRRKAVR